MRKRYLTYDIKTNNSYEKLYEWFEEIKAKKITESTYEVNTNYDMSRLKTKIKSLVRSDDNLWIITCGDNGVFAEKI